MPGVFVSYAREDAAKAKAVARLLQQASLDVWFDERIHSGSEYSREIEQALGGAAAVVVLWSRNSVESAWVRDEAAEGRDSGRLVPVLLDDCRPPIGFRQFQATDLSRWSGRGRPKQFDEVIAAVHAKAGAPSAEPRPEIRRHDRRLPLFWLGLAAALLVIAIGAFVLINRTPNRTPTTQSIALQPFTADSADVDARKLALAAHDSIVHTLSQGAFAVTTSDTAAKADRPASDYLMSGAVSSTADKLVVNVRMEDTARHVVVFSRQFEAERAKAGDFAQLIGVQVASQLSWTAPLLALERRHPSDPAIVAALLQASTAGSSDEDTSLRDYETSRRLAPQAPNSPLAQNSLAFNTAFALLDIPREERPAAVAAARRAAERTVQIAPDYGSGYSPWCLLHSGAEFAACEDRLRAGMRADPDDPFANWFLSRLLNNVGRNAEAVELASASLAHDPYMPLKIAQALRLLEVNGRSDEAEKLYRQSVPWWPANEAIHWYRLSGIMQRGDFAAMQRFGEETGSAYKPSSVLVAVNRKSLPAVRQACASAPDGVDYLCMLGLADLGDLDAAFAMAGRIYPPIVGRTEAETERIWLDNPGQSPTAFLTGPAAAPLRRDPRFIGLAQRVGLLAYWRSGHLPDFCRERPEPICSELSGRR